MSQGEKEAFVVPKLEAIPLPLQNSRSDQGSIGSRPPSHLPGNIDQSVSDGLRR